MLGCSGARASTDVGVVRVITHSIRRWDMLNR